MLSFVSLLDSQPFTFTFGVATIFPRFTRPMKVPRFRTLAKPAPAESWRYTPPVVFATVPGAAPAVEAAACGTAVIATTESPLPQLLAGGGLFVAPGDEGALADAMRTLHEDEPRRALLAATALERARRLTWHASARATLDTLLEAAA